LRKNANQEIEKLVVLAEQELSRVVQITKNMLSLYRESKQVIPLKLTEVVESVNVLMERRLRDKNVAFSTHFLTQAQIRAFPAEMRQVVSNLVANAIDAVEPGGEIKVTVEEGNMKDSGAAVALTVSDNGAGIPKDVQAKLFRPFHTTKGENGTGLGLWITQGIVAKHGGYIEVTSNDSPERHGTTFRVVFPRLGAEMASATS
jgi:signal transduction histidine kinase